MKTDTKRFWVSLHGNSGGKFGNMEGNPLRASRRKLEEPLLFIGDGLKGLPEAMKEVYPEADFQSCILHRVLSLHKVRKRDREALKEEIANRDRGMKRDSGRLFRR